MDQKPFTDEQIRVLKTVVNESMNEYFASKGTVAKQLLIGTAAIVVAVTVILGGIKTILGWLGFVWLSK